MDNSNELVIKSMEGDHEVWMTHPMTRAMVRVLDAYEKRLVDNLVTDISPINQEKVYHHGVEIKTLRDIKQTLTNKQLFVARATKLI